jgi:hypothetical protein
MNSTTPFMRDFGFIITRHVNSETTNKYWNFCIQSIRRFYPLKKIVVIDDNSNLKFLNAEFEYKNVEYVDSEFPGRGELLPYYYFYKNNYFDNAIIIHDSVFMQKRINFELLVDKQIQVMPLWHFFCEKKESFYDTRGMMSTLNNNYYIMQSLIIDNTYEVMGRPNDNVWAGCFGAQSFINRNFLIRIRDKYNLFNLLKYVTARKYRCCLERIMGILFHYEYLKHVKQYSLLGNIKSYCDWGYTYQEHCENMRNKKIPRLPLVKVWSGR